MVLRFGARVENASAKMLESMKRTEEWLDDWPLTTDELERLSKDSLPSANEDVAVLLYRYATQPTSCHRLAAHSRGTWPAAGVGHPVAFRSGVDDISAWMKLLVRVHFRTSWIKASCRRQPLALGSIVTTDRLSQGTMMSYVNGNLPAGIKEALLLLDRFIDKMQALSPGPRCLALPASRRGRGHGACHRRRQGVEGLGPGVSAKDTRTRSSARHEQIPGVVHIVRSSDASDLYTRRIAARGSAVQQ